MIDYTHIHIQVDLYLYTNTNMTENLHKESPFPVYFALFIIFILLAFLPEDDGERKLHPSPPERAVHLHWAGPACVLACEGGGGGKRKRKMLMKGVSFLCFLYFFLNFSHSLDYYQLRICNCAYFLFSSQQYFDKPAH